MSAAELRQRLAAVEQQLTEALGRVTVLRQLLAEADPEAERAEEEAHRIWRAIASEPAEPERPALRVLEGAPVVDAASVKATAVADQSPGWAAHSDRVAGRARRAPRRDRHGLHSL